MRGYAVIIEGEGDSYSACVPELPGCVAAGKSIAEVEKLMLEAIEFHIEGMREAGVSVPRPTATGTTIIEAPPRSWLVTSSRDPRCRTTPAQSS